MPQTPAQQRPAPRKTPRQARSAETVSAIVEGAARVLERVGLGGLTTNAVADCAGVSIGSVYQYFPGKEALIGALIVRETSALIADWEAALVAPSGQAALSDAISSAVTHQLRRPRLARLLDLEEARMPFDEATQRVTHRLVAILRALLCRPDIARQSDPDLAARDVLAIIKGMIDAAGERGERDSENLCARVRRAVLGYLGSGG